LWDTLNGAAVATISEADSSHPDGYPIFFGSFSTDSSRFVTYSGSIARIWNAETGKALSTLSGHADDITYAEFSPDGRFVITISRDKTARLWDARFNALQQHGSRVFDLS
jgi:WD40 repeat protein